MLAVLMTKKTLNLWVWLALAGWLLLPQISVSSPVIDGRADWDVGPAEPFSPYHTTFRYDSFNRLQEQTFANGDHWSYQYNLTGTLKQKTDPKGQTTTYTYDSRQRPDVSSVPGTNPLVSDRDYDTAGRLSEVRDTSMELLPAEPTDLEVATCSYTYDTLGRTLTETSYGRTHSYGYDLVGNKVVSLLKVQGDRERLLLQSYDAHNRLTSMVDDNRTNTTGDDKTTEYGYDLVGRVLLMKTSNGNTDVSATVNTYDVLGRLTLRKLYKTHSLISTNLLVSFTQSYDVFGNVASQYETWMKSNGTVDRTRTTTMTYDQANRLKTEVIQDSGYATVFTTYVYDGASNRTGKTVTLGSGTAPSGVEVGYWTYTYNEANQLERTDKRQSSSGSVIDGATYLYDDNGNRISQLVDGTTAAAARTTTYGWDAWDRLREVKVPTTATAQKTYRYSYDYRMRRIAMAQTGGGLTTRHTAVLYSGGLSVAEYNRTNNNTIMNSTLSSMQYVRGPDMGGGVGGLLYTFRRSGDSLVQRFNLSNGRGDIVAQTSNTGALTWTASYEAYGKQTKETGTNNDRQRANSKEEDPTGLLNEGHRYRDLETGVWLSRDPAGFVDGPNLYAYVQQNPWSKFDAEGLEFYGTNEGNETPEVRQAIRSYDGKVVKGYFINGPKNLVKSAFEMTPAVAAKRQYDKIVAASKHADGFFAGIKEQIQQDGAAIKSEVKRLVSTPEGHGELGFSLHLACLIPGGKTAKSTAAETSELTELAFKGVAMDGKVIGKPLPFEAVTSHADIAKRAGVLVKAPTGMGTGVLKKGAEAFSVYVRGNQMDVTGSPSFTMKISEEATAAAKKAISDLIKNRKT